MEEPELCYELTQKMWGGDIATQAAQACLRYAFERVGLERMIAGADAPNITSLRVIEKLGMKHLGHINPSCPGRTLLCAVQEGVRCGDGDGLTTYE